MSAFEKIAIYLGERKEVQRGLTFTNAEIAEATGLSTSCVREWTKHFIDLGLLRDTTPHLRNYNLFPTGKVTLNTKCCKALAMEFGPDWYWCDTTRLVQILLGFGYHHSVLLAHYVSGAIRRDGSYSLVMRFAFKEYLNV